MSRNSRKCEICEKREYGTYKAKLFFANFPLDEDREWLRLVGNQELVWLPIEKLHHRFVCADHFDKKAFNKKRSRLKKTAVPRLNLKSAPLSDDQLSEFPLHVSKKAHVVDEPISGCNQATGSEVTQSKSKTQNISAPVVDEPISGCDKATDPEVTQSKSKTHNISVTSQNKTASNTTKRKINESGELETPSIPKQRKGKLEETVTSQNKTTPSTTKEKINESVELGPPSTPKKKKVKLEESGDLTPRKKKLMKQLKQTKCNLASLRKSAKLIEKIESPVLKELILSASKNQKRNLQGRRWSTQSKISCLAILKRSAKTYRYLRHLMPLPSVKTLQNVLKKLPMQTGINKSVLDHLVMIGKDIDEKDKLVALLFDEMALKPRLIYNTSTDQVEGYEDLGVSEDGSGRSDKIADHALVFLIQGLYKKMKQPIAVYFVKGTISSEKLTVIIKEIITCINATGFRVLTTVCDQGPTNMGAIKLLKQFSDPVEASPGNAFTVNGQKVYMMYDVPHLFKSIRNNFLKNGNIVLDGRVGKWLDLVKVEEKNRKFLYLSKITATHVNPKYRAKMKVKYAAQALSNTVAAVLKLQSEAEENRQNTVEAKQLMDTALVVQELDRLFDITNGPSGPDDVKMGFRQNVSNKTNHLEKWAEYEEKIKTMKFVNDAGIAAANVKCLQGYILTLKSLRSIWLEVSALGFKYLNLRQLNQDALENLFGIIRQHSPTSRNPTCAHFMAALKTAIVTKMTAPHSRGSNCAKDSNYLMTDFHKLIFEKEEKMESSTEAKSPEKEDRNLDEDVPVLSLPDDEDVALYREMEEEIETETDHAVIYISGYLASRIMKKIRCDSCKSSLTIDKPEEQGDMMYSYIRMREWWADRQSLTYPTKSFCSLIGHATMLTEQEICSRMFIPNIGLLATTKFLEQLNTQWYLCSLHKNAVMDMVFDLLGQLLIRRQCQRVNYSLSLAEEGLADAVKKAQQQGKSK